MAASSSSFHTDASSANSGSETNADRRESSSGSVFEAGHDTGGFHSTQGNASASGHESLPAANGQQLDPAIAAFKAADLNRDGRLDQDEFRQFVKIQLQYESSPSLRNFEMIAHHDYFHLDSNPVEEA